MKTTVVAKDSMPASSRGAGGKVAALYAQLQELKPKDAMRVEFDNPSAASYTLTRLRKIATENGDVLVAGRAEDGTVRFFWIETVS